LIFLKFSEIPVLILIGLSFFLWHKDSDLSGA
jgi:hypothetical protein